MEKGDKFICSHADWYNAFGESVKLDLGQKLTLRSWQSFAGAVFLAFEETPPKTLFLSIGFKSYRSLN